MAAIQRRRIYHQPSLRPNLLFELPSDLLRQQIQPFLAAPSLGALRRTSRVARAAFPRWPARTPEPVIRMVLTWDVIADEPAYYDYKREEKTQELGLFPVSQITSELNKVLIGTRMPSNWIDPPKLEFFVNIEGKRASRNADYIVPLLFDEEQGEYSVNTNTRVMASKLWHIADQKVNKYWHERRE